MEQEQKSKAWQEEQALTRFEIIQPLLSEELDPLFRQVFFLIFSVRKSPFSS